MKINPKEHATSYKTQGQGNSFTVPPSGTYLVVNTKVTRSIVGANKTPKLRVRALVLAHVESEGGNGTDAVGKLFSFDVWANWTKPFNVARISHLGIACGQTDSWDPDEPAELVRAITGVPYQMKMVRKESEYNGQTRQDAEPVEVKGIGTDARAKYTKSPDWPKTVGNAAERYEDIGSATPKGKGSTAPVKADQPDPFKDDDIPF